MLNRKGRRKRAISHHLESQVKMSASVALSHSLLLYKVDNKFQQGSMLRVSALDKTLIIIIPRT